MRTKYKILVRKPEGKTWKTKVRKEDNIKMDFKERQCGLD
jgi:hypothetical protein